MRETNQLSLSLSRSFSASASSGAPHARRHIGHTPREKRLHAKKIISLPLSRFASTNSETPRATRHTSHVICHRLHAAGHRLHAAGHRLHAAGHRLNAAGHRLHAAGLKHEAGGDIKSDKDRHRERPLYQTNLTTAILRHPHRTAKYDPRYYRPCINNPHLYTRYWTSLHSNHPHPPQRRRDDALHFKSSIARHPHSTAKYGARYPRTIH